MGRLRRFHGVLMRPLGEQKDRDGDLIDPAGLKFDPDRAYPIFVNFGFASIPVGRAKIEFSDDGSIVARGELVDAPSTPMPLAAGVKIVDYIRQRDGRTLAKSSELTTLSLVDEHQDPGQPVIEYDE